MPGLRLTPLQVQRLCGIDGATSATVLSTLVDLGFLERGPDGQYQRATGGPVTLAFRMAKAGLRPAPQAPRRLRQAG